LHTVNMVGMNPCYCWNLKDGCITVGIWTLICSIIQLAIFSWQSYVIKWERDKTANRRLPFYGTQSSYDFRYYGPDYSSFYVTPEERFFTGNHNLNSFLFSPVSMMRKTIFEMYSLSQVAIFGWQTWIIRLLKDKASNERYTPNLGAWRPEGLFVIQILCLISAFFLLFGSVSLIYGIHTNSKHLVWPWFPCVVSSILCSVAYCITWWASGVDNYWLILTIIEWFSVMINLYALLCVIVQYRRILRNYDEYSEEQKVPVVVWDDQNQKGNFTETKLGPEAYWNKTFEEEPKPAVKSNVSAKGPSQFFGTQFGQKPMPYHAQITSALNDPGHVLERYTTEPGIKANDRYDARSFTALNVATDEAELPAKEDRLENDIIAPAVPIAKRHTEDEILRSRSVDALTAHLEDRDRRSVPHSKSKESITSRHRHRSHSHHRGDRREDDYSDEETDIARSVAGSRSRISETDTGYSCSDGSRRSRHRRRHHSHDESERGHHHRHRRHRRPRDVKRDDKERSHSNNNNNNISNANNRQSSTNSSPAALQAGLIGMPLPTYSPYEMGAVRLDPNYGLSQLFPSYSLNPAFNQPNLLQAVNPSYSPVGGIQVLPTGLPHNSSIGATNAHITKPIPGQTGSQPQKFQINSEIFISYNNDPANQASRPSSRQQVIQLQPVVGAASLGSKQHSPGVDFNETMEPRNSSAAGSVDSKGTGATAV
ncbi:hypothetical protein T10_7632, partial [Trichinella papuae]